MAEPLKRPADWQSILEAPPGLKAEVLDGALLMSPRPRPAHGLAQAALSAALFARSQPVAGEPRSGWWLVIEPDVLFDPHNIVSPDLCGWRRERLPELPESGPIALAPDWICEVVSPTSARHDRIAKADLYLRGGVPFYWILDPTLRTLEALAAEAGRPESGRWVRLGAWSDGDAPSVPPFDALPLDVGGLFVPVADES
jgi:Uma2 family endonuclease